jgi:hypothetical protein
MARERPVVEVVLREGLAAAEAELEHVPVKLAADAAMVEIRDRFDEIAQYNREDLAGMWAILEWLGRQREQMPQQQINVSS